MQHRESRVTTDSAYEADGDGDQQWKTEGRAEDDEGASTRGDIEVGRLNTEGDDTGAQGGHDDSGDGCPPPGAPGLLDARDLPGERHER